MAAASGWSAGWPCAGRSQVAAAARCPELDVRRVAQRGKPTAWRRIPASGLVAGTSSPSAPTSGYAQATPVGSGNRCCLPDWSILPPPSAKPGHMTYDDSLDAGVRKVGIPGGVADGGVRLLSAVVIPATIPNCTRMWASSPGEWSARRVRWWAFRLVAASVSAVYAFVVNHLGRGCRPALGLACRPQEREARVSTGQKASSRVGDFPAWVPLGREFPETRPPEPRAASVPRTATEVRTIVRWRVRRSG